MKKWDTKQKIFHYPSKYLVEIDLSVAPKFQYINYFIYHHLNPPSLFTLPTSDFGSGDLELHSVL